ncbi:MAG: radical SAM family heme chaperone HemW [Treponema sp.]|jgi:oxygen-independent coproporphyrinogen-3 oxidase|nr:radical SAM family heme chaperone HemW [Treponema sp.]
MSLVPFCASLYVHIPFCAGACDYCDFYSVPAPPNDGRMDALIDALLLEGEERFRRYGVGQVPTVYIGGGTPSVLGADRMTRLLGGLAAILPGQPGEFTVEVNPESADRAFLEACRAGGVSRISLGVQSFHEPSRRAVHRVGEGRLLTERLKLVAEIFGDNFSADLMTGLPFQHEKVLLNDIEKLLVYKPGHISLYSLTVEEGTVLAVRPRSALPPADEADRLWIRGRDFLEAAGYEQYEVSNFSLPGKQCRHNIRYWRMENWIGVGPAASGTIIDDEAGTGRRHTVCPDVDAWLAAHSSATAATALRSPGASGPVPVTEEFLDPPALMKETLLMGFRYTNGPDAAAFRRRFRCTLEEAIPQSLAAWRNRGLLRQDRAALNRDGLLFLNPFLLDVFGEVG